ncbi:MAG: tetraacyldisaccharide 4'-kinase [Ignavibacteriaceae bacterium]|jgi:tetraacyldisaccharide 4'-kinase|nr:tetraacyldisaccharide 4'-kinase [Ignavibacteriaceae bacterium]
MKFLDLIRIVLIPLTPIYELIIRFRNFLFDKGVFKAKRVSVPIISVGNLTVGGSGKTPLTIYIAELLKSKGYRPAILSRGYGRKSKGYLLVSKKGEILTSVEKSGDEIFQCVVECRIPAAVSENRVYGAKRLLKETEIDVIILDDAFQHRWINRDLDVVIFEQRHLITSNRYRRMMLPTGNMREPIESVKRGDVIVINRKFSEKAQIGESTTRHFQGKKVFNGYYETVGFVDLKSNLHYKPEEFVGQKSLVVSGIANPYSFINALKKINIETANHIVLRDHKFYTEDDIKRIRKEFYALNVHSVITTQKDAVRLFSYLKELDDIDIFYLKIEIRFDNEKEINNIILNRVTEVKNNLQLRNKST